MSIQAPWKDLLVEPLAGDHVVQTYRDERFVVDAVSLFTGLGIGKGEVVVLVATRAHLQAVEHRLEAMGIAVDDVKQWGQLTEMDAAGALAQFMVDGMPDRERFLAVVRPAIRRARASSRSQGVRVYGEMVDLLWKDNLAAAARLEQLWNEVVRAESISLFCAYGLDGDGNAPRPFPDRLRALHSHLIPVEAGA